MNSRNQNKPEGEHPLFQKFPKLKAQLKPLALCKLPTAVKPIHGLSKLAWVKCDDNTHDHYGGNKVRKFEFIIADIAARKSQHVYTLGGSGTNHGVATAMVCQQLGLKSTVITFKQPHSNHVEKNQFLMRHFGANIISASSIIWAALRFYLNIKRLSKRYYFLPGGGATPIATFAYINAAFELKQQIDNSECPEPYEIYVPVGSSSTLAGLTLGCALAGLKTKVVGIQILDSHVGPIETCTPGVSEKLMKQALQTMQRFYPDLSIPIPEVILNTEYFAPGYGVLTPATTNAINTGKRLGLKLEQTYSGKAFDAFLKAHEKTNKPIMYWATYSSCETPHDIL